MMTVKFPDFTIHRPFFHTSGITKKKKKNSFCILFFPLQSKALKFILQLTEFIKLTVDPPSFL